MSLTTETTSESNGSGDASAAPEIRGQSAVSTLPPSRIFAWDKGNLAITDEAQREKYRRPSLSPSTAKAMDGCPARWAAEKALGERDDPFSASSIGTSAHSVLEDLYDLDLVAPKDRTPLTAMNILLAHSKEQWPGRDSRTFGQRGLWIAAVHDAYKGIFDIEEPAQVVVHSREMGFGNGGREVEINGVPFIGYIDRIDYTPEGLTVIDYKSSAKRPVLKWGDDHGDQMRLYAEVLRVIEGKMPAQAMLYYTRLGQSRQVPLKPSDMRKVLGKFKKAWIALNRYIDTGSFPTNASALCGWCPLVNACPTAAANGKEARREGLPEKVDLGIPVLRTFEAGDLHAIEAQRAATRKPSMDLDFGSAANGEPVPDLAPALDALATPSTAPPADDFADADLTPPEPLDGDPATGPGGFRVPDVLVTGDVPHDPESPPDAGSERPRAAHLEEASPTPQKDTAMTADTLLAEDKPWVETINGNLNPNAYAATAVFGLTAMAYDLVHDAGQKPSKTTIDALTQTFAHIIAAVQHDLTGVVTFQDGIHTRLRGALHSYIDAYPLPFGKDRAAWDAWVATARKHVNSIASAALRLYDADLRPESTPWTALADGDFDAVSA